MSFYVQYRPFWANMTPFLFSAISKLENFSIFNILRRLDEERVPPPVV